MGYGYARRSIGKKSCADENIRTNAVTFFVAEEELVWLKEVAIDGFSLTVFGLSPNRGDGVAGGSRVGVVR